MGEQAEGTRESRVVTGKPAISGSVWLKPERPDRGSASPLGRTQIVRAAIALIDEEGVDALSMRKLAARMGVGVMSLYWHVERKDDLLELIGDEIFGEMTLPDAPTGDWRADLSTVAYETRKIFFSHPWLLQTIGTLPHFGPNFLRHAEFSFGSLTQAGVDPVVMAAIVSTVDSYVFGSLLSRIAEARSEASQSQPVEQVLEQFQATLARGQYPALQRMMSLFESWVDDDETADRNFRFGLDCLLDGIEARLTTCPDHASRVDVDQAKANGPDFASTPRS